MGVFCDLERIILEICVHTMGDVKFFLHMPWWRLVDMLHCMHISFQIVAKK